MMTTAVAKPLSRAVLAAVIAIGLFAAVPSVANAAPAAAQCVASGDYASSMNLTVDPPRAHVGETVDIKGTGYPPNCELTIYVDGKAVGTVVTDPDGSFTLPWTIPAGTALGNVDITTSVSDIVKHANLEVIGSTTTTVAPTTPGTELPRTGSDVLPLLAGGVALLVLGSLVVLSTRKRSADQI